MGPVKTKYFEGLKSIRRELEDYWLNSSFTEGFQWTYWLPTDNTLNDVSDTSDRFQAVINRTRSNMRYLTAQAVQRPLKFNVLPTASDDASTRASRAGEALLEDLRKSQGWEGLREESINAIVKGGTGAIAVDWDDYEKEVVISPLGITEFMLEPGVRRYQQARWWIKVQALPPQMVKDMFPEEYPADRMPVPDARTGLSPYQHKLVGLNKYGDNEGVDLTLVLTYYERPHRGNEEGKFMVEVENKVLDEGVWPFSFKELNIAVGRETVLEDQWSGSTFLNDVRRVQVMLNILWTQVAEHVRNVGTGRLLVPQSAWDVVMDTFTDEPGQMVPYPDGLDKPEFMHPPSFGAYIERLLDRSAEYIDDLFGQHGVSRGLAPGQVESGLAVQILTENDSSPLSRLVKETSAMWQRVAQMTLALYQQRGSSKQLTVDMGLGPERLAFNPQQDLKGQRDVVIPTDALLPRSRAAQEMRADKLLQTGVITDMVTYSRVADLANAADIIKAIDPDAAKAMRENEMMAEGNNEHAEMLREFDNHETHEKVHRAFLTSQRFDMLDEADQTDAVNHWQAHKTLMSEMQAKVQRQEATAKMAQDTLSGGSGGGQAPADAPAAPQEPEPQLPPELSTAGGMAGVMEQAVSSEFPGPQ